MNKNIVIGLSEDDVKIISQWFEIQDLKDIEETCQGANIDCISVLALAKVIVRDFNEILEGRGNDFINWSGIPVGIEMTIEQGELIDTYMQCLYIEDFENVIDKYNSSLDIDEIIGAMIKFCCQIQDELERLEERSEDNV